jgi:transposase-like protein
MSSQAPSYRWSSSVCRIRQRSSRLVRLISRESYGRAAASECLADPCGIRSGAVASVEDEGGQAVLMRRRPRRAPSPQSGFAGFRFPPDVIMVAVRWYLRYGLSYRDVEELLTERGITVDHVTVYRWVQRFTPLLIDAARPCRHAPGDRWCVDETYVKVAGRWVYLYRSIDQHGQVIDVLVSEKRDLAATRRFFTRALSHSPRPSEVVTDQAPTYPRVLALLRWWMTASGRLS